MGWVRKRSKLAVEAEIASWRPTHRVDSRRQKDQLLDVPTRQRDFPNGASIETGGEIRGRGFEQRHLGGDLHRLLRPAELQRGIHLDELAGADLNFRNIERAEAARFKVNPILSWNEIDHSVITGAVGLGGLADVSVDGGDRDSHAGDDGSLRVSCGALHVAVIQLSVETRRQRQHQEDSEIPEYRSSGKHSGLLGCPFCRHLSSGWFLGVQRLRFLQDSRPPSTGTRRKKFSID